MKTKTLNKIYTMIKPGKRTRKIISTENDWNQRATIKNQNNEFKSVLKTKEREDPWHVVVKTEYQNPSTFIFKQANIWSQVNKSHEVHV